MSDLECPACWKRLEPTKVKEITVDVCRGCGGIWFDAGELQRVDNPEETGKVLLALARDDSVGVRHDQPRDCPRCDVEMTRGAHGPGRVQIDECPDCGGIWLDAGELEVIREYHGGRTDAGLRGSDTSPKGHESPTRSTRRIAEILGIVGEGEG